MPLTNAKKWVFVQYLMNIFVIKCHSLAKYAEIKISINTPNIVYNYIILDKVP